MVVADSWFGDSKLMRHVATTHEGTFLVEGKSTYIFALPDGRQVKGSDLQQPSDWPWRSEPAGAWGALCAAAGDQSDVWRRDPHRGQ